MGVGVGDVAQAAVILFLSLGIVGANLMLLVVLNSRRYSKYIHQQVRTAWRGMAWHGMAKRDMAISG